MNIVVSGTGAGIGLAIARLFAEKGHEVYGFDKDPSQLEHERYHHVELDIRNQDAIARMAKTLPAPEVLVNNAGTLDEATAIDVNLVATIAFTERFVKSPSLRSILFVASASARNGAEFPQYVASKAGIVGYMKNLALSVAERGITCNSVSPGGVVTSANDHILQSPDLYAQVKAETLLGKWASPEEVADLVYYLTIINRSITGEDVLIDNGEMLRSNFIW